MKARIEYTVESRNRAPIRKAKEVLAEKVEREIEKLSEKNAFNFNVKYEADNGDEGDNR